MKTRIIFTFIALVVIGLCTLLYPAQTTSRLKAEQAVAAVNLKTILMFCQGYAQQNEGRFPADWSVLLTNYVESDARTTFVTKQHLDRIGPADKVMEWTDFVYVSGANINSPEWTVIAYLPAGYIKSNTPYLVVFLNGDTAWLNPEDFTKAMNKSPQQGVPGYRRQGAPQPER